MTPSCHVGGTMCFVKQKTLPLSPELLYTTALFVFYEKAKEEWSSLWLKRKNKYITRSKNKIKVQMSLYSLWLDSFVGKSIQIKRIWLLKNNTPNVFELNSLEPIVAIYNYTWPPILGTYYFVCHCTNRTKHSKTHKKWGTTLIYGSFFICKWWTMYFCFMLIRRRVVGWAWLKIGGGGILM